jgi:hypothetical protein
MKLIEFGCLRMVYYSKSDVVNGRRILGMAEVRSIYFGRELCFEARARHLAGGI